MIVIFLLVFNNTKVIASEPSTFKEVISSNEFYTLYYTRIENNHYVVSGKDIYSPLVEMKNILSVENSKMSLENIQAKMQKSTTSLREYVLDRSGFLLRKVGNNKILNTSSVSIVLNRVSVENIKNRELLTATYKLEFDEIQIPINLYILSPPSKNQDNDSGNNVSDNKITKEKTIVKNNYITEEKSIDYYKQEISKASNYKNANISNSSLLPVNKKNIIKNISSLNIKFFQIKADDKSVEAPEITFKWLFSHSYIITSFLALIIFVICVCVLLSDLYVITFWNRHRRKLIRKKVENKEILKIQEEQ
ncbi:MAG: hypothetical protein LBM02_04765 [Lachnospiraceae bacterium]|jgi:hypothetical protein|nr:hypothetical protein [Lachnospiraceae bacterium]